MLEINKIHQGDCIEIMKQIPENSIDAIITDPPYGLEFMGKEWDKFKEGKNIAGGTTGKDTPFGRSKPLNSVYQYSLQQKHYMQNFFQEWGKECLRVLKSGGFLLSMGGTRTYHRMVCGIEDAGFEIRDTIMWLYGSGFPKSLNIGRQLAKMNGEDVKGEFTTVRGNSSVGLKEPTPIKDREQFRHKTKTEWEGWGTALKPAVEPIVVARKPLSEKNVALNVLKHGTGGINIDACRIPFQDEKDIEQYDSDRRGQIERTTKEVGEQITNKHTLDGGWKVQEKVSELPQGRFPANIILDEEAGKMLDEQSGNQTGAFAPVKKAKRPNLVYGDYDYFGDDGKTFRGDKGGASRFFYCAKASKSERNLGCENLEDVDGGHYRQDEWSRNNMGNTPDSKRESVKNNHPTVKPIKLMEYLIKLVTRENAIVLDPFLGSGTTMIACLKLNRRCLGIEKEEEYIKIANARLKPFLDQTNLLDLTK